MNNKELALFSLGAEKCKKLEAEIIAAYIEQQAKEVPVLPEPAGRIYHDNALGEEVGPPSDWFHTDQLQAYGAACAAHARGVALRDGEIANLVNSVTTIARKYHDHQSLRQRLSEVVLATLKKVGK